MTQQEYCDRSWFNAPAHELSGLTYLGAFTDSRIFGKIIRVIIF
jgi:hypothetical protein